MVENIWSDNVLDVFKIKGLLVEKVVQLFICKYHEGKAMSIYSGIDWV